MPTGTNTPLESNYCYVRIFILSTPVLNIFKQLNSCWDISTYSVVCTELPNKQNVGYFLWPRSTEKTETLKHVVNQDSLGTSGIMKIKT